MSVSVITDELLSESRSRPEHFGYSGLGELVFRRTYVRQDEPYGDDLTGVLARVVDGVYRIQRERQPRTRWDEAKARRSAEEMFWLMRDFAMLPPGRGLWTMGTDFVHDRGVTEALQNCAFLSTRYLPEEAGDQWRWFSEMLMLGVGVGFDTKGAGTLTLTPPSERQIVIRIDDSRQGWGHVFELLWNSYQADGAPRVVFDVSSLRPKGSLISGFGGRASGPGPLVEAVEKGRRVLDASVGRPLTSRTIVDFANLIGECVVAGNVRRSAEIALGDPTDTDFIDLKNPNAYGGWDALAEARPWYWLSNNSVMVDGDEPDYTDLAERIYENGEPGVVWLDAARRTGRTGEFRPDWDAAGVNPCAEQQLGHREMCTLVEVFLPRIATRDQYLRTLKFAYLYAKTVTVANEDISDDVSRAVMMRNRRIGLSTTGVAQFVAARGTGTLIDWWRAGYDYIDQLDETYSRWLGVPRSVRTTSIKPSGTVSLLPGVTPGVHYPVSRYYMRRVDVAANSELVPRLREAGYELEDSVTQPGVSYKVLFPVDAGEGVRSVGDVPLVEQVALAALAQKHHADNMVSFTGTFSRETTTPEQIARLLRNVRRTGALKSISMLPAEHGYAQAPYEPTTRERYEDLAGRLRSMSYEGVAWDDDHVDDKYCDGEVCELGEAEEAHRHGALV